MKTDYDHFEKQKLAGINTFKLSKRKKFSEEELTFLIHQYSFLLGYLSAAGETAAFKRAKNVYDELMVMKAGRGMLLTGVLK